MRPTHLLAAAGALLLIPAAHAVTFPYGTAVGAADYDYSPVAETQKVALCFIDGNADGVPGPDEPVFLATKVATNGVCPATLSTPSILLDAVYGRVAGSEISIDDTHFGSKAMTSLTGTHFVRYWENGADTTKLDSKDTVYIDLRNVAAATVDVGDLRISPFVTPAGTTLAAGTFVANGDGDLARPLANIKGTARQMQDANVVYKAGSGLYLNSDVGKIGALDTTAAGCPASCPFGDIGVETNDIRLNLKSVNPWTDAPMVVADHVELVQASVAPGQPFQVKVNAKNAGVGPGAGLIETRLDGVVVDARGTPTLGVNEVQTLVLTLIAPTTPGMHTLQAGTYQDYLSVQAAPTPAPSVPVRTVAPAPASIKTQATVGAPSLAPTLLAFALAGMAALARRAQR